MQQRRTSLGFEIFRVGEGGGRTELLHVQLQAVFVFVLFCNDRVTRRHSHLRNIVFVVYNRDGKLSIKTDKYESINL